MKNLFFPNVCINFHDIHDIQWFEDTIKLLNKLYTFVSLGELYSFFYEGAVLKNSCHITFDDGDITFYQNAFPILKKYNVPVSIYVSPKIAKEQRNFWFQEMIDFDEVLTKELLKKYLSPIQYDPEKPIMYLFKYLTIDQMWEVISVHQEQTGTAPKPFMNMNVSQLLELQDSGLVSIGAHTQNHPILLNEDSDKAEREIRESISELESLLGTKVLNFAYPNGKYKEDFSEREMSILQENGIKLAFSTEGRHIKKGVDIDVYRIPRMQLSKGKNLFITLKLLMGEKYETLKKVVLGRKYTNR